MFKHNPKIEVLAGGSADQPPPLRARAWYRSPRFLVFFSVFLISATLSLIYVFSQPAIYQSNAVLLTVATTAIDKRSGGADIQHVAIQRQLLTGENILQETLSRIQDSYQLASTDINTDALSVPDLRNMLNAQPVSNTNLVELIAEGSHPALLPLLLNTWIDVYLSMRTQQIEILKQQTSGSLSDELAQLDEKINEKRLELEAFRQTNNIASIGRNENEAMARLKGLNASLNKASEQEVKAKAHLQSVKAAIARGQIVVPKQDAKQLAGLQKSADRLRNKLHQLDQRFTREYLALQPSLKEIPKQLTQVEKEIEEIKEEGKYIVLADAEQQYHAAQLTTASLKRQLKQHQKKVSEFTARFSEHEVLKDNLAEMQKHRRNIQQRLVKIETRQLKKYPQFSVVDRAFLPRDPIYPDYQLHAIIAVSGSLLLALFSAWAFSYLSASEEGKPLITITGAPDYNRRNAAMEYHDAPSQQALQQADNIALSAPQLSEIAHNDLHKLFSLANRKSQQLISLLFNGLSLQEILEIRTEDFDFENDTLKIKGANSREIAMNEATETAFNSSSPCPLWQNKKPITEHDLRGMLLCAAVDSGISHPDDITIESLRHSYIIFLVRQGIKLSDIDQIIGTLQTQELLTYRVYSPPSQGIDIYEINTQHPALDINDSTQADAT